MLLVLKFGLCLQYCRIIKIRLTLLIPHIARVHEVDKKLVFALLSTLVS